MKIDPKQLVNSFRKEMDPTITVLILGSLVLFGLLRAAFPDTMRNQVLPDIRSTMLDLFGPLFLLLMIVFVVFAVVVVAGPWGKIRLGGQDATPSYTYPAYFAMFFSAGIAAGIVFWAPTEALFFYDSAPPFVDAAGGTEAAEVGAMQTAFFHWGISAWSAYVAIALPIAYYVYNKGAPLRVATLLMPFIGKENLDHPAAKLVDVLAVFATIGGVGVSVGLTGQQFLTGAEFQWGFETDWVDTLIVVGGLTVVFTVSVITGVKRGIRRIAGINLILTGILGVLILVLGPTGYILTNSAQAFVAYVVNFPLMSAVGMGGGDWYNTWTLFYWVWWFSWAPFAGLFLASISRGRTLRTVTLTGVLATSAATLVWFGIVSSASLHAQTEGVVDILALGGEFTLQNVAGFALLDSLPLGTMLVLLFFTSIITWMVTSADTSVLIISILGTKPTVAPESASRAFWALFQGAMAFALIVVGGANALQTTAVITGGPIGILALVGIIGLFWSFYRTDFRSELPQQSKDSTVETTESVD